MLKKSYTRKISFTDRTGYAFRHVTMRHFVVTFALALILVTGCAKHPSSTSPVGGKGTAHGQAITKTALSNVGVRYKLGGNSPTRGFDCSGLVLWTYGQYGIKVPRTAREQMQAGRAIRKEELRPGDLVVFKISGRRGYHSGIYTGKGKFVHSPSTGQTVREDSIDSKYWKPRFVSARRLPQVIH